MEIRTRRRRALSTVLALVLAIESVSAVAAVASATRPVDGTRHALPAGEAAGIVLAGQAQAEALPAPAAPRATTPARTVPDVADNAAAGPARKIHATVTDAPGVEPRAGVADIKAPPPARSSKTASSAAPTKSTNSTNVASATSYKGRNHVWIPSLGINRSVSFFSCDRSRPPDNYVYRWGCAGRNNVYLMGHAYSVFKPLHDAYVGGRLKVGMKAWYADGNGKVRQYRVKWWKVTRPTTAASWAWAAQSVPSMTLQTCVGARSEYRLMVRLVEVR